MDSRIKKLAHLLVHYSVGLKKKQLVRIQGEPAALPLIEALFEEAIDAGAYPFVQMRVPRCEELFLKKANDDQLSYLSPIAKLEVNKIDAMIALWGSSNTKFLSGVDPKRQVLRQKAQKPIMSCMFKRVGDKEITWVGTQFPTQADAQLAEMSLADYEDFVYGAGHIDDKEPVKHWLSVKKEQVRLVKILNRTGIFHLKSDGTDLKMNVKGRKWISCHGTNNFPDGEIFTSPHEESAEGKISFTFPASYLGREVEGVVLEFKKGKAVKISAGKNKEYLDGMLSTDVGAKRIGEIAIGTNYGIKKFTHNVLFDEKIGGTCHMAMGASIPEAGGKNISGIHWDMVTEMKKGGEIYADQKLIYRNGKFII